MEYPQKPQAKPLVQFRVNGGGTFVYVGRKWFPADPEIMTNVVNTLNAMVRFSEKF